MLSRISSLLFFLFLPCIAYAATDADYNKDAEIPVEESMGGQQVDEEGSVEEDCKTGRANMTEPANKMNSFVESLPPKNTPDLYKTIQRALDASFAVDNCQPAEPVAGAVVAVLAAQMLDASTDNSSAIPKAEQKAVYDESKAAAIAESDISPELSDKFLEDCLAKCEANAGGSYCDTYCSVANCTFENVGKDTACIVQEEIEDALGDSPDVLTCLKNAAANSDISNCDPKDIECQAQFMNDALQDGSIESLCPATAK